MVKDAIGNVLAEGDLVQVELPNAKVMGYITSISAGGIITGLRSGGRRESPGMVRVVATFEFPVDPATAVRPNLVKLCDPRREETSAAIVGEASGPELAN